MTKNARPEITNFATGVASRIAVSLAFIASGLLCFLVSWSVNPTPQAPGAGWLVMLLVPFWLGVCVLSVLSGYKLGGRWRVVGWLPLLFDLLGSLLIN